MLPRGAGLQRRERPPAQFRLHEDAPLRQVGDASRAPMRAPLLAHLTNRASACTTLAGDWLFDQPPRPVQHQRVRQRRPRSHSRSPPTRCRRPGLGRGVLPRDEGLYRRRWQQARARVPQAEPVRLPRYIRQQRPAASERGPPLWVIVSHNHAPQQSGCHPPACPGAGLTALTGRSGRLVPRQKAPRHTNLGTA